MSPADQAVVSGWAPGMRLEEPRRKSTVWPVVILCGGKGTRISDVSQGLPKPLVPIGGFPILWHIMKIYAHQGFTDFVLCLGYKGDLIEAYFSDESFSERSPFSVPPLDKRRDAGWNITFAYTGENTPTGGRVKQVEHLFDSDRFMLTYGDGLADIALGRLAAYHLQMARVGTVTGARAESQFGVIETRGGIATSYKEKPLLEHRINGGFFVFSRAIFDHLDSDAGLEDVVLGKLVATGELAVFEHDGFWRCMDTRKDYEALNGMWQANERPWQIWPPLDLTNDSLMVTRER